MFVPVPNIITEELLIDFRELIGEHTGENLAEAVYETLQLYELKDKVSPCTSPLMASPVLAFLTLY
jgi:hypothetical protein